MTERKPQPTPALDKLEGHEYYLVLTEVLALHPELRPDAEHIALALLAEVDAKKIAESIEAELRGADLDQLSSTRGSRSGEGVRARERGGGRDLGRGAAARAGRPGQAGRPGTRRRRRSIGLGLLWGV